MKKKTPDFVISLGDKRTGERMCETLPPTLAGPIEVMSFLLFSSPRENGGDKGGQSKLTNGFSQPRKSYQPNFLRWRRVPRKECKNFRSILMTQISPKMSRHQKFEKYLTRAHSSV